MTGPTKEQKLAQIAAKRGPLDNELYAAELDLDVAKKSGDESLVAEPKERVDRIKEQLSVLDEHEAKAKKEKD